MNSLPAWIYYYIYHIYYIYVYYYIIIIYHIIPGAHRSQKRVSDPLELEFQEAVSRQVGARN